MPKSYKHPGDVLAAKLEASGVTPTEFARQIDVPPNRISQIIHGKRAITGDTALRLAHWFNDTPEYWMELQAAHDVRAAEEQSGAEIAALPRRDHRTSPGKSKSPAKGGH